jgi:poly(A) polymerase
MPIPTEHISINALKVMARLNGAGYQAFLVGGGVRDLLLGLRPKDFDIATDAHPDEIRELFRNSRHIGRRFKIIHIRFGREIIEVATFRAFHDSSTHQDNHSDEGMILRDNVYGSFEDDVIRRDFTVNALYYQAEERKVYDLTGGLDDIQQRLIRLIGDPETRYREDPVRMLRAIRFAAKLDFQIHPGTAIPIRKLAYLLADIPPARLFEEVLKLFMAGFAEITFDLLKQHELLQWLFPKTVEHLDPAAEKFVRLALRSTDDRIRTKQPVTPAFVFAALLWPQLDKRCKFLQTQGHRPLSAFHICCQEIIDQQLSSTSLPRRFSLPVREIWDLQYRLPQRRGRRIWSTFNHKRFRAAYDFLLLREQAGEMTDDLGAWWTLFQEADDTDRNAMIQQLGNNQRKRQKNS